VWKIRVFGASFPGRVRHITYYLVLGNLHWQSSASFIGLPENKALGSDSSLSWNVPEQRD
jgi:hypothetical protein